MNITLLTEELEHRGITKEELARKCSTDTKTIHGIFSGNRRCTVELAKKIVNELNMDHTRATEIFLKD